MLLVLLTTAWLAADPVEKPQAPVDPVQRPGSTKGGKGPVNPTSADELFEKAARLRNQIGEESDIIERLKKLAETNRNNQKEHEKVLKGERPYPQPGDPLIAGTLARTSRYDPKIAIDAITIANFSLKRKIDQAQRSIDRYKLELTETESRIEKLSDGPYLVLSTIPLGAPVEEIKGARKVDFAPAEFDATFGRVVLHDANLKKLDAAVLRAIFPILVDIYELDDFKRPELIKEFGKIRLLVERRTGLVFAVGAEWSASGTEAVVVGPEMAKRTREILTVIQSKYPDLKEENGRIRDAKDRFISVTVTNEKIDAQGRKLETAADDLRNLDPAKMPAKNSVYLTYMLKSGEKRVIEAVRRIETRHAFGSLEEIKKKGDGL